MITLVQAECSDLDVIEAIQRQAFKAIYDKYQDQYNPYLEARERIEEKFTRPTCRFYLISVDEQVIGFLRVQTDEEVTKAFLGGLAILPEHQSKGYGSHAILELEKLYPTVTSWTLYTVLQEEPLVSFYERQGYQIIDQHQEQEGMDMVFMQKKKKEQ